MRRKQQERKMIATTCCHDGAMFVGDGLGNMLISKTESGSFRPESGHFGQITHRGIFSFFSFPFSLLYFFYSFN